jgi:hypothetical protein
MNPHSTCVAKGIVEMSYLWSMSTASQSPALLQVQYRTCACNAMMQLVARSKARSRRVDFRVRRADHRPVLLTGWVDTIENFGSGRLTLAGIYWHGQ